MKVAIIMGSNSDWPILEPAEKTLKEFGVEVEVVVASAHRTPIRSMPLRQKPENGAWKPLLLLRAWRLI